MMKFKSLFRKGHGHGSSASGPSSSSNVNLTAGSGRNSTVIVSKGRKASHFEQSAVPLSLSDNEQKPPATAISCNLDNCGSGSGKQKQQQQQLIFENNVRQENNKISNLNKMNGSDHLINLKDKKNKGMELEFDKDNALQQLENALKEKRNLENKLDEYLATNGELETLKMEVAVLKQEREDIQKTLVLKLAHVNHSLPVEDSRDELLGRFGRLPNSAPASIAPLLSSGSTEMLDTPEWDKHSSSSLSEVSVACLQDRIIQMEETHYSTNEELQATLQELADLQTQLTELQSENERLGEEKGVLLESLCRQTEKLEDARTKVDALQGLLLNSNKEDNSFSEREQKLVELLKDGQTERESLLIKQKELTNELEECKRNDDSLKTRANQLQERISFLESTVDTVNAEINQLEEELTVTKEDSSSKSIEIKRLTTLLENARSKIDEIEVAREKQGDKSELDEIINNLRKEKDLLETGNASLQEQLSLSICEVTKLKEQLAHVQEEYKVARNNAKSALSDLEYKYEKNLEDTKKLKSNLQSMRESYAELQVQSQCHLDDKDQLKSVLSETQKHLADMDKQNTQLQQCLDNERKLREKECAEWDQFQSDLLMTVRVANDIKTEAQVELERLVLENKQLRDKIIALETYLDRIKQVEKRRSPVLHRSISSETGVSLLSSMMNQEMNRRSNLRKQDSRLSVKSLIESIENATKQAKTGPRESLCNSTTSLNSLTNHVPVSSSAGSEIEYTPLTDSNNSNAYAANLDEMSSAPSSVTSRPMNFIHRSCSGDLSERKDPLQALVKNGGSKRNALLKWCQNKTLGYSNIDITNFSSSWNDGLALCAILHSYLPAEIPYDTLNPSDKRRNFSVAFKAAESVGIKTTLNLNDMIQQERPDWNQVMAYVTSIFRHFEC